MTSKSVYPFVRRKRPLRKEVRFYFKASPKFVRVAYRDPENGIFYFVDSKGRKCGGFSHGLFYAIYRRRSPLA